MPEILSSPPSYTSTSNYLITCPSIPLIVISPCYPAVGHLAFLFQPHLPPLMSFPVPVALAHLFYSDSPSGCLFPQPAINGGKKTSSVQGFPSPNSTSCLWWHEVHRSCRQTYFDHVWPAPARYINTCLQNDKLDLTLSLFRELLVSEVKLQYR